jgi:hypothetical protein
MSPDSYAAVVRERFPLVAEDTGGIVGFAHLKRTRATTLVARIKKEVSYEREQGTTNESSVPLFISDIGHPAAGRGIRKKPLDDQKVAGRP